MEVSVLSEVEGTGWGSCPVVKWWQVFEFCYQRIIKWFHEGQQGIRNREEISSLYSSGLRAVWSGVRVPVGAENFPPHPRVHTGSGTHPASCPVDTRGSFPRSKAAGAWSWPLNFYLVPRSRMRGATPPLPHYAFMVCCSVKKSQGQPFTFYAFVIFLSVCLPLTLVMIYIPN